MVAPCLVQGIPASFVVALPDSTSIIILELLRLSQHLLPEEALLHLLLLLPPSPVACRKHGNILVVICEFSSLNKNPEGLHFPRLETMLMGEC